MDELLKPVTTRKTTTTVKTQPRINIHEAESQAIPDSDSALQTLKGSPNLAQLQSALEFLVEKGQDATSTQAINVLFSKTIPDWWKHINKDNEMLHLKSMLLDHLRQSAALSLMLSHLKVLVNAFKDSVENVTTRSAGVQLELILEVISEVLSPSDLVLMVYRRCSLVASQPRRAALWREASSFFTSGQIISNTAEAEDILKRRTGYNKRSWVGQGNGFCEWLGRNVAVALSDSAVADREGNIAISSIIGKALALGYQDAFVSSLLEELPLFEFLRLARLTQLNTMLPAYQQRLLLSSTLKYTDSRILDARKRHEEIEELLKSSPSIDCCAALIQAFFTKNEPFKDFLVDLCVNIESSVVIRSFSLRRLVVASISDDEDRMAILFEKLLSKFGDQLFIKHAPATQQEAVAQVILMAAGYIHRSQPMLLFTLVKSSTQIHGTSNRLKAPSQRAQWLGMLVAMALSDLTDKSGSKLVFDDESMQSQEAKWYQALVHVNDKIGSINGLKSLVNNSRETITISASSSKNDTSKDRFESNISTGVGSSTHSASRIVEIINSDGDDEDELISYSKPDSDPEDEDDDPTLVERNKPRRPVYIRDLLTGLREMKNYDRHRIALKSSASLIRRKAAFGKELHDHAEELLNTLLNLNNQFEMEDFLELRQEALISLLVSEPKIVGPSLARCCFEDEFSVQQRTAMLTSLALGARELAGHGDKDNTEALSFPSKELPKHLQTIYGEQPDLRLTNASRKLEESMVGPLALSAADQLSGPNALKVRTFSSRMKVPIKGSKVIKNATKDITEYLTLPLIAGWWTQMQSFGRGSITFSKYLVPLYLRTLAVVLHASGPSTLELLQLTTEIWDILLSVRTNALHENDVQALDALLFAFLILLELNEDKERLAHDHARELVETQEWAKLVLDQYGSVAASENTESGKVKMLAAATIVKCHEVVERWQRLMLGDLVDV
ncbi:uncharacterized protein PV09_08833 [Verruconis gallopava]|uniref:Telomere length regulation protein conserved domain-containing protein n=1 Tax=Verruconis gallopava TaxID=253628 RepID=A0A0D1YFM7_9PEZI|nr:uncharacterized protein PV09_08833 [Verruconis gallopava]KIV99531.1 hypothetical protein PV09_08833 [Verruconis gallopava]